MSEQQPLVVTHIHRGRPVQQADVTYKTRDLGIPFATPRLDVEALVWPRPESGPLFQTPISEVIDFLVETGTRLSPATNPIMQRALEGSCTINNLATDDMARYYDALGEFFRREYLEFEVTESIGDGSGWRRVERPTGNVMWVQAYPIRLLHFLAGNGPGLSALSIVRGALSRGVNMLKLASNDLFTAPAILATMADIDADHPVVRSFSAAYWRGGDDEIESKLFRTEFFDTVVAWGGESAIRNVQKYIGPGLDLVALNPKASISLIGHEAFADAATLDDVARRAASDVGPQEACQDSRFQFVEGTDEQVDQYCERLLVHMRAATSGAAGRPTPPEIRSVVEALPEQHPDARAWGEPDGLGLVIRSPEPLDIYPIGRTVNVVPAKDLTEPTRYVDVETQTVGIYPQARKRELREAYFGAGVQRIVTLGGIGASPAHGRPHDGFYVLARMVRWVADEDLLDD